MFTFFRNLKIRYRLGLLVALLSIALLAIGVSYIRDKNNDIQTVNNELTGVNYLVSANGIIQNLQKHRGAAAAVLSGDASFRERYDQFLAEADKHIKDCETIDAKSQGLLNITENAERLKRAWETLKAENMRLTPRESNDRHSQLIEEYLKLILEIGDTSTLILDPEITTYHLAAQAITNIPQSTEAMGQIRAYGLPLIAQKQAPPEEKDRLIALLARVQQGLFYLNRDITFVSAKNPALKNELEPLMKDTTSRTTALAELVRSQVIRPETITIETQAYFTATTTTIDSYFALSQASSKLLTEELTKRQAQFAQERLVVVIVLGIGIILAMALAIFITTSITRQVNALTQLFSTIGMGDFAARAEVYSQDELGTATSSLNAMLDNTLTLIQSSEERDQIQQSIMKLLDEISGVAEGDLTQEAEVTAEMTGAIADSFNFMIGELRRVISNVQEVTLNVSAAATEVQTTTEHLAEGSESQAVQIVDTSAAIEEMAASIQQVSENAVLSATVSEQARSNAKQGSEAVQKTISGMNGIRQQVQETAKRIKRLGESSQEIGEIVQLIGDIADRTSILALNASIQAAMAGEAGRGFAVVAGEVERLAERSAEATKRISTLIKTIQSETNEAVAAMETATREVVVGSEVANEAGKSLVEIESVSNRLAELMQSISMATKQQARGSESVAKAMGNISDITQQTAAGTKQAAVSIRNLSELADNLRVSVSTFKLPTNGNGRY